MPHTGDNFRSFDNPTVYYYNGKGKFSYSSQECFFKFGNPPFETNPEDGGVKYIEKRIVDAIPYLGDMCGKQKSAPVYNRIKVPAYKKYLSTNYLLDNFSDISHFTFYTLWALSLMFYLRENKNKSYLTFAICFLGGAMLEFVQLFFIEGRNASFEDEELNCLGAVVGIVLFWILQKMKVIKLTPSS
ncbi:MAG: VanZ family protein [Bacteroidetes bacterium]|nr:VanZ family protein [Bacteroidota bacterium]